MVYLVSLMFSFLVLLLLNLLSYFIIPKNQAIYHTISTPSLSAINLGIVLQLKRINVGKPKTGCIQAFKKFFVAGSIYYNYYNNSFTTWITRTCFTKIFSLHIFFFPCMIFYYMITSCLSIIQLN